MASLRNFINAITNDNRIYTAEDIGSMTNKEFMANEKAIDYQMANLGIPRESDLAGNPDVVYVHGYTRDDGTEVRAHYRSKPDGVVGNNYQISGTITGAAAGVNHVDDGFDRPLNIYIKGHDTGIPNLKNYNYYDNLNDKLEYEVGDFLRENTNSPELYSNDIRHQYVSALYARNLGEEKAKWLGDLNEILRLGRTGSGSDDTELDKLNNEIGRNYARQYPNISKEELLQILLTDWDKNSQYTKNILRKMNKK